MFRASISYARAISVLLGGSGVCQPAPSAQPDVGVLLSPRKRQMGHEIVGATRVGSVDSQWQVHRHD